jgi:hypothetical protein
LALAYLLVRCPTLAPVLARWLTISAWILILFPVASLVRHQMQDWRSPPMVWAASETELLAPGSDPPDVFYVILDGYGRSDSLLASYDYDNTEFLDFLASRGFYVAEGAMSNYSRTLLSLASSLNMDYLDGVLQDPGFNADDPDPLHDQLHRGRVLEAFRTMGYSIVGFESGYSPTELTDADSYLSPPASAAGTDRRASAGGELNEFEVLFLQTTMVQLAPRLYLWGPQVGLADLIEAEYDDHRERVRFAISGLSDIAAEPGSQFVFAHIVSPHPPFVFGPNGESLDPQGVANWHDRRSGRYLERYIGQMKYLNGLLMDEVDEILQASDGNAIIVLQGDHGPAGLLEWKNPTPTAVRDRMEILNAYYLPGVGDGALYPSITPVNTFRVIFDEYFGGEYGLLEDVSYFSNELLLSDMVRITPAP